MDSVNLDRFIVNARGRFDRYVRDIVAGADEALPKVIFKITIDKKVVTKSRITPFEGGKDYAEAYYYYLPMYHVSDGTAGDEFLSGGVGSLYVNANAIVLIEHTTMTLKGQKFELEIVETQNVNDEVSKRKSFSLKNVELIAHPEPLGGSCGLFVFEYTEFKTENTKAKEDGTLEGAKDTVGFDYVKGAKT